MAEDVPGGRPVDAAALVDTPPSPWVVIFALIGVVAMAWCWASACPAKPLATFLVDQGGTIGSMLFIFALPYALVGRNPLAGLRDYALPWAPLYLVAQVRSVASMTVGWEGGWVLGIAGAVAGAAAGAVAGWVFTRWTLPEIIENRPPVRAGVIRMSSAFAVLFALYGAHNWSTEWLATPDEAWMIVIFPIAFAFLGALVRRPLLALLSALPLVAVQLIPLVALVTAGWEDGWTLGIAGAVAGAAAGAATGWLYNRWIMPEYEKRRARESAVRPLGMDAPRSNGSMA